MCAICPRCSPQMATLREYATSGIKQIMGFTEEMKTKTDSLPDDVKPFAERLNEITLQALVEAFAERLKLISELGLQEIVQAAMPPTYYKNQTSLKRSESDGI
jgi:hypothetical protein